MYEGGVYDPVKDIVHRAGDEQNSCIIPAWGSEKSNRGGFRFFGLPFELRLVIYEFMFRARRTIVINPINQQISTSRVVNKRMRDSKVAIYDVQRSFPRLPVAFLATCWQVNREATPVLYKENRFLVEHVIPLEGQDPYFGGYFAYNFFLWHLRQSTLSCIRSLGFTASCRCGSIAFVNFDSLTSYTIDVSSLCRILFPPGLSRKGLLPGEVLAAPEMLRKVYADINRKVMSHLGWVGERVYAAHQFTCDGCKKWTL